MCTMSTEYKTTQEELTESVVRAARYEGHASAMVIAFCMTNKPEKIAVWEAEEQAWQRRVDNLIDGARVGHLELRIEALRAHNTASMGVDPVGAMRSDPNFM